MYSFPIALQLYSVRDDAEADFLGTLKKVKSMGYNGVEFAGLYGYSANEVKQMCEEAGLVPVSAHVAFLEMMDDPELLKVYKEIGCNYVVIPYLSEEYRPDGAKFHEVIAGAKFLGQKAKELGLTLCYHNHSFEFEKIGDEYALDILYKEVPADLLSTQLDTCWVNVGGENPADYIRKYAGRVEIVHLKDFVGTKAKQPDEAEDFELRPVGYGVQDFPAILEASKEVEAKWLVVEQDMPSMGKTPLECAEASINYLNTINK